MLEDLPISDLRSLITQINTKYAYDFSDYALASFKRRIIAILNDRNLDSCQELIDIIISNEEVFKQFLCDITVNTTEMFRDPEFWSYFKNKLIPKLAQKSSFKIWHAGCSSGEEVYSMAIMLEEAGVLDRATITATDISTSILDKAQKGVYSLSKLEINNKNYTKFEGSKSLDKYYSQEGRKIEFDSNLLRNVTFLEHNLADGVKLGQFDVVICRNVMIYFNSNLQDEVFKLFHKSLSSNGILAIGARESMIWSSTNSKYQALSQSEKVFKKIAD